jgi:hypothetical protein
VQEELSAFADVVSEWRAEGPKESRGPPSTSALRRSRAWYHPTSKADQGTALVVFERLGEEWPQDEEELVVPNSEGNLWAFREDAPGDAVWVAPQLNGAKLGLEFSSEEGCQGRVVSEVSPQDAMSERLARHREGFEVLKAEHLVGWASGEAVTRAELQLVLEKAAEACGVAPETIGSQSRFGGAKRYGQRTRTRRWCDVGEDGRRRASSPIGGTRGKAPPELPARGGGGGHSSVGGNSIAEARSGPRG